MRYTTIIHILSLQDYPLSSTCITIDSTMQSKVVPIFLCAPHSCCCSSQAVCVLITWSTLWCKNRVSSLATCQPSLVKKIGRKKKQLKVQNIRVKFSLKKTQTSLFKWKMEKSQCIEKATHFHIQKDSTRRNSIKGPDIIYLYP